MTLLCFPRVDPEQVWGLGEGSVLGRGWNRTGQNLDLPTPAWIFLPYTTPPPSPPDTTPMELASKNQGSFINKEQQNRIGDIH